MTRHLAVLAVFLLSLSLSACSERVPEPIVAPRSKPSSDSSKPSRSFTLMGIVRQVDRDSGEVSIAHQEIPGFMPAMTMPFSLKGQAVLDDIQVGDSVEGTLVVDSRGSRLEVVEITEEARPPSLSLTMENGQVTLREKPKVLEPGDVVPDFSMTTQAGDSLALSDLRGKTVVLTFVYTRCPLPEYCPLMDRKFADLARRLELRGARAGDVRLLSVSFDPDHDTPEILAKHAKQVGARPPLWQFSVATHDELRKVAEPLGLMYAPMSNEIAHSLSTAVIGADGRLKRLDLGREWTVADLLTSVLASGSEPPKTGPSRAGSSEDPPASE